MNMLFPGTEAKKAVLYDVLYVPKFTCNLFSVRAAVAKGNTIETGPNNRPFPSCSKPPLGKEAKCEVFVMKIFFYSHSNNS